jgi:DNA-nicking Smr family endonuclease
MSKKKRCAKSSAESYNNNPFKQLKGFAVSEPEEELPSMPTPEALPAVETERSFAEEMDFLGVDPLDEADPLGGKTSNESSDQPVDLAAEQSDEELFLGSLGQLDVRFSEQLPQKTKPAMPRRLKQLKQGRLTPDASLDLHGLQRHQVVEKVELFLQNATRQQWQTLLIITGRGLHSSDGEPVLRDEAEKFLAAAGKSMIAEWGRAPRQYGGEGALVVFLKRTTSEDE